MFMDKSRVDGLRAVSGFDKRSLTYVPTSDEYRLVPLEDRVLLTAEVSGDLLTITGDGGDNDIVITVEEDGLVSYSGVPGAADDTVEVSEVVIDLGDGDDSVTVNFDGDGRNQLNLRERDGAVQVRVRGEHRGELTTDNVERLRLNTGDGNDNVNIGNLSDTDLAGGDTLEVDAGDGNDTVNARRSDIEVEIDGGDGRDRLQGGDGDDLLVGGDGRDTINGGRGDDTLDGGDDRDRLNGQDGDDELFGGDENDHLNGGRGDDDLRGGDGDDRILGGGGVDLLGGDDGDDRLNGGGDTDVLNGGAGDDRLLGGGGDDLLIGGDGDDRINGGGGNDTAVTDGEDDRNPRGVQNSSAGTAFVTELTTDQVVPIDDGADPDGESEAGGLGVFLLNEAQDELSYVLMFDGIDLNGNRTNSEADDLTGLHIHNAAEGVNGPHTLNIAGAPGEDDGDLVINARRGTVEGIWDDGDVIADPPTAPGDTKPLTDFIDELFDGELYVQLHTNGFPSPNTGELRGQIVPADMLFDEM